MNPELKQKWIDALRSGEYRQCSHALRKEDSYCCLGVLADLVGGKWERPEIPLEDGTHRFVYNEYGNNEILPKSLVKEYELNGGCVLIELPFNWNGYYEGEEVSLSELNDGGADFETIARVIEETTSL